MAITKADILSKCGAELVASRDCQEMARVMSIGYSLPNNLEIGNGTILEVLGFVVGNAVLDAVNSNPMFKYVKPLIEQGRLQIGKPMAQAAIMAMAPSVMTLEDAKKMVAVGWSSATYTPHEISKLLYNEDGSDI